MEPAIGRRVLTLETEQRGRGACLPLSSWYVQRVLKNSYVHVMRSLRKAAEITRLLHVMDRHTHVRFVHWMRSLLAIYSVEDLVALDVPWWSYKSIDVIQDWLEKAETPVRVFEWGSGASTVWLQSRAHSVISVEHDLKWAGIVRSHLASTVDLLEIEPTSSEVPEVDSQKRGHQDLDFKKYVEAIDTSGGEFDLIVIDGRARVHCLRSALERLAPGGVIVFDNAERSRYSSSLKSLGDSVTMYRGLTPAAPFPTSTAVIRP